MLKETKFPTENYVLYLFLSVLYDDNCCNIQCSDVLFDELWYSVGQVMWSVTYLLLLVPFHLIRSRLPCFLIGYVQGPIPNFGVPITIAWATVVLCQVPIGYCPYPFPYWPFALLCFLLACIMLIVIYLLSFVFYFVPFFPCSDSEHDIVLRSSFTRSWPTYCQDLLSYDTSLVIDHLNFQCQLNAHRLGIVDYLNDILQVLLRRFRVIDVVWHN